MSERARRPTEEEATAIFDPGRQPTQLDMASPAGAPRGEPGAPHGEPGPRRRAPGGLGVEPVGGRVAGAESFEQDVTEVTPLPGSAAVEYATRRDAEPGVSPGAPIDRRRLERSEPIRVISMKDHTAVAKPRSEDPRIQLQVQLRSMAEVAGRSEAPVKLGHLAPPRDPRQARARRVRANVIWGCVAVALAGAIALAIWLVAGR
jgi:hypothetical protein